MGAVYFYHLTNTPLETTLPSLLSRATQAGWRIAVRGRSDDRLKWLDEKLWLQDDTFLAHGEAGDAFEAEQPILLTKGSGMPNGATCLMTIDGADVTGDEVAELDRVCILFDGNDPDALQDARGQWKLLTDAGCAAQYWTQENGSWAKKAEAN